jgi:hypothetical protein
VVRSLLSTIAREEAEHAGLSWAIVAWCLEESPGEVAPVLEALVPVEPRCQSRESPPIRLREAALVRHGRLPGAALDVIEGAIELRARRRLERLLGRRRRPRLGADYRRGGHRSLREAC